MNILDLPDCMLEQVLEILSYDEIAKQRIVSLYTIHMIAKEEKEKNIHLNQIWANQIFYHEFIDNFYVSGCIYQL